MNYPQRILVYLSRDQHFNSIVATDNKGAVVQRVFSSLDSSLFDRARILMNLMRNVRLKLKLLSLLLILSYDDLRTKMRESND